ncbi:DUF6426 family protein [Kitasatospora sp. NPDC094015]|uniref:DUF6426 family protein n=1 Tax=Kitasatospora sp. NPDC094015 TaxID=3155205 RepID=UPI003318A551
MKLRNIAMAAALGATVLTTVPAITAPFTAYASCVDDHSSCGDDDDPPPGPDFPDPDIPGDPGFPGDPGDGGGSGGDWEVTGTLETVITNGSNVSTRPDEAPAPVDGVLPTVVVTGSATRPPSPAEPGIPNVSWGSSGGGTGAGENAIVYRQGKTWEQRQNCYRNANTFPEKHTETINYNVSYQTSANISAKAGDVLTATLGTQLNTTVGRSQTVDVTLNPGDSWALYVEYQTTVYAITTYDWLSLGYKTEYVNVTAPTGVATGRAC